MNRLVIVGNGFDLAHGLPTGYCDFIDNYWKKVCGDIRAQQKANVNYEDDYISIVIKFNHSYDFDAGDFFERLDSYKSLKHFFQNLAKSYSGMNNFTYTFKIHNDFFKTINREKDFKNWVDIENEYYKLLKECLKETNDNSLVRKLNEEFEQVKKMLSEYLKTEICEKYDFINSNNKKSSLTDFFDIKYRLNEKEYLKEFPNKYRKVILEFNEGLNAFKAGTSRDVSRCIKDNGLKVENLFLTFNYTPTLMGYKNCFLNDDINYYGDNKIIHIHGEIGKMDNTINFGFGDEMDDDYKMIENKDDNEYLKNIKSFQYFQNSNYRKMLDFIDSADFQVYIMGHSCGLSDRILLNKIFEHHNCGSIKVFYHQFDEPKSDGRTDNYTEIVQNISRHFNKKEMMREKIVNKSLCQPLPQDIRFAKIENSQ